MSLTVDGTAASRAVRSLWVAGAQQPVCAHIRLPKLDGGTRIPEFLAINPQWPHPRCLARPADDAVQAWRDEQARIAIYLIASQEMIVRVRTLFDTKSLLGAIWTPVGYLGKAWWACWHVHRPSTPHNPRATASPERTAPSRVAG